MTVKFKTSYAASECIKLMEGRWFAERQIKCYYWDGTTDFTVKEDAKVVELKIKHRYFHFDSVFPYFSYFFCPHLHTICRPPNNLYFV